MLEAIRDPFKNLFDLTFDEVFGIDHTYHIKEDPSSYELALDLPGAKTEDIRVAIEGNVLSVQARREETRSWAYSWFVPPTVNTEAITCGYENGVLTLVLPKLESAKMRPIKVSGKVEKTEKQAAHAAAR